MVSARRRLRKRAGGPKHHDAVPWSEVGNGLARIDAGSAGHDEADDAGHGADRRPGGEVQATRDQFDLEAAVWVKPAEATKTGVDPLLWTP